MSLYQWLRPSTEDRFPKPALLPTIVETFLDHVHQSLQCPQLQVYPNTLAKTPPSISPLPRPLTVWSYETGFPTDP